MYYDVDPKGKLTTNKRKQEKTTVPSVWSMKYSEVLLIRLPLNWGEMVLVMKSFIMVSFTMKSAVEAENMSVGCKVV